MIRRHILHLLIFSFAIVMVLVRPYAAYQIATRSDFVNDPVKVFSLLQRLVKKKDEHHALANNDLINVQQQELSLTLPVILLLFFQSLLAFLTAGIKRYRAAFAHVFTPSENKHYLLLARLQI